jgi:hypothetical protein
MIQGAMFSVVSAVEVSHNFRNPNPDHLHQDMMLNFFGSSQSCTWNRAKWTMTLERCYRVSKCFGSGSQDVPVEKIVLFPWKGRGWLFSPSYWVNNVPGPHVYPHIDIAWIGSSPSMCEKTIFRSLKNCFSAKPKFSSSYWGIQCFRSPRLSTYRFCVDWKQSKHVRKKIGAWKLAFLRSPDFIPWDHL